MSGHWQMRGHAWGIEIIEGFHEGSLYGLGKNPTMFLKRSDVVRYKKHGPSKAASSR